MVFPNTYGKIIKLARGDERGGREARARVLRHRPHARASGRSSTWACSKPPLQFSFIVNVLGGIPPHVESLQLQTKIMPRRAASGRSSASATASGACSRRRSCSAATSAAGSRTTSTCRAARWRSRNGELVEVAARMVRDVGRKPATVEEAREILGAPGRRVIDARPTSESRSRATAGVRDDHALEPRAPQRDRPADDRTSCSTRSRTRAGDDDVRVDRPHRRRRRRSAPAATSRR